MAYVALYRAYRPQKFSEVVGQKHIIKTLQNAIKLNKVAHAYLFCGPRGTGKTTLAKIMAKALNCQHGPSIEPCDECEICLGIQKGMIPDVVEIDAASNNGADDIRALRDSVKYLPSVGRYKVYIIDEVHMLSNAAFNALLKTLEEPPKHVVFILATTEPYKLPNTILSRCQRFDFQAISKEDIFKRLRLVAESENVKMSDEVLNQIASSAEGGMRDALSLFDQTISYSVNDEITLDDVLAVSGNVSYLKIISVLENCLEGLAPQALLTTDEILKEGKEVPRIINDIIIFLRDVLLFKNNAIIDKKSEFTDDRFISFSNLIKARIIYEWLNILNEANNNMRFSNQKRAYLELAILKMSDTKLNEEASLLERIEQLEEAISLLSNQKVEVKKVPDIVVNIPSQEEIKEIANLHVNLDNDNSIKPVDDSSLEIKIEEIEAVLNSANKKNKLELQEIFNTIKNEYQDVFVIQILTNGELVAVSDNKFIVVLNDLGFSNRLMNYNSYEKVIAIINKYNANLNDYICIPKAIWNKIKIDYLAKYKENPIVKLNPLKIGVLRRVVPVSDNHQDEKVNKILEYIDKEKLEIMEE